MDYDKDKQKIHQENQSKAGTTVIHLCPLLKKDQIFCFCKTKEEVSDSEFQDFIDGPDAIGVNMGLDHPLNNHCQRIDHNLIGREGSYQRSFLIFYGSKTYKNFFLKFL